MDSTAWSKGLDVTAGGRGIVSHAGVVLLRALADRTGLTGGLSGALARRGFVPVHDRGRVLADLAVAIADGATVISDFAVLAGQREVLGPVASVPTVWRALEEIASGGPKTARGVAAAVNAARVAAWEGIVARHGTMPGVRIADRVLGDVICIRLDATVTPACSDKEGAEPNFKGFGHHPLLAYCDNTDEALAGMMRPGRAGSNTVADHLRVLDEAITAVPAKYRRKLMVTLDGAGASHDLITRLDKLAARRGRQLTYSVGWAVGERERDAIAGVPANAWEQAVDGHGEVRERRADGACPDSRCGHRRCWVEEAHVTELTALLRAGRAGDQLAAWPESMRVLARRERPHPGAQLTLFETRDGWRYTLWVTNLPAASRGWRSRLPYIDAAHRVHARVEDRIRTGKDCGIGHFPSRSLAINTAWLTASLLAATLLAWLRHLALDGDLARSEPKALRYRVLHTAARLVRGARRRQLRIPAAWPWADDITQAWRHITALPQAP
jgi:hypothetical protein